jgi:hypothetical protein
MANFTLIKNNIVLSVIVIDNNIITDNETEIEQLGIDFINSLNIKGVYLMVVDRNRCKHIYIEI